MQEASRFAGKNLTFGVTAIGAFSETTLGYFDWEKKVLALVGDIARGSHLLSARVRPTLEVIVLKARPLLLSSG